MADTIKIWNDCFKDAKSTFNNFLAQPQTFAKLNQMTEVILRTFQNGGTIFTCGNGGSHCDSLHFAEEWTGRYRKDRKPMAAIALGDGPHLTCVANDFGFEHIFERQVLALGRPGDLLLFFTTSGNSKNQILALEAAKSKKMATMALSGRDGGQLAKLADLAVVVPAKTSDRVQEVHIKIVHAVIETVERILFPELY